LSQGTVEIDFTQQAFAAGAKWGLQRGQQAGLEKAAQLRKVLEALIEHAPENCGDSDCDCLHYKTALNDARTVLASAEPPQREAEKEGRRAERKSKCIG